MPGSIRHALVIYATTGLIIERDNGEGTAHKACTDMKLAPGSGPASSKQTGKKSGIEPLESAYREEALATAATLCCSS